MKYVSFKVEESDSFYCIELDKIISFIDSTQIDIKTMIDKTNNYIGITSYRNNVYKVLNTKYIFELKKENIFNKFIFFNTSDFPILIPVYKIIGIFDSEDKKEINTNSSKFNFVIKNEDNLNILVDENFLIIKN